MIYLKHLLLAMGRNSSLEMGCIGRAILTEIALLIPMKKAEMNR